jgi:hypothetical protein
MREAEKIDFIGIGAARSGTTWLCECLRQHPDILFPIKESSGKADTMKLKGEKELDFFIRGYDKNFDQQIISNNERGIVWYLARFPAAQPGKVRGEFSPTYMADPGSANRIHKTFPDVKLIVVLRNPPDMIYSLYWWQVSIFRMRNEVHERNYTFEDAVERGFFLKRGLFHSQLKKYYDLFPRDRIHVIVFDDILSDPNRVIREAYAFLGVRTDFIPSTLQKKINRPKQFRSDLFKKSVRGVISLLRKAGLGAMTDRITTDTRLNRWYSRMNIVEGKYPPMRSKTRRRLEEYYRDDIANLEALTGRDLSAWRGYERDIHT